MTTFLLSCPPPALLQSPRSIHRCLRILSKMKLDFNIIAPIWTNHRMSKEMSFTSVCKAATRLGASWLKVSSAQGVFYRSELWDLSGRWALDHTTTRSTKVAAKNDADAFRRNYAPVEGRDSGQVMTLLCPPFPEHNLLLIQPSRGQMTRRPRSATRIPADRNILRTNFCSLHPCDSIRVPFCCLHHDATDPTEVPC